VVAAVAAAAAAGPAACPPRPRRRRFVASPAGLVAVDTVDEKVELRLVAPTTTSLQVIKRRLSLPKKWPSTSSVAGEPGGITQY